MTDYSVLKSALIEHVKTLESEANFYAQVCNDPKYANIVGLNNTILNKLIEAKLWTVETIGVLQELESTKKAD